MSSEGDGDDGSHRAQAGGSVARTADHAWSLPRAPYVPGETARPDAQDEVYAIAREAPDPTDPNRWRENAAWLAGLGFYRAGYFWEAHEVWEAVWARTTPNSAERMLVQGVIQLANAGLKQKMARPTAVQRLAALAIEHIADAALARNGWLMGLDLVALERDARAFARGLERDEHARLPEMTPSQD